MAVDDEDIGKEVYCAGHKGVLQEIRPDGVAVVLVESSLGYGSFLYEHPADMGNIFPLDWEQKRQENVRLYQQAVMFKEMTCGFCVHFKGRFDGGGHVAGGAPYFVYNPLADVRGECGLPLERLDVPPPHRAALERAKQVKCRSVDAACGFFEEPV